MLNISHDMLLKNEVESSYETLFLMEDGPKRTIKRCKIPKTRICKNIEKTYCFLRFLGVQDRPRQVLKTFSEFSSFSVFRRFMIFSSRKRINPRINPPEDAKNIPSSS